MMSPTSASQERGRRTSGSGYRGDAAGPRPAFSTDSLGNRVYGYVRKTAAVPEALARKLTGAPPPISQVKRREGRGGAGGGFKAAGINDAVFLSIV